MFINDAIDSCLLVQATAIEWELVAKSGLELIVSKSPAYGFVQEQRSAFNRN